MAFSLRSNQGHARTLILTGLPACNTRVVLSTNSFPATSVLPTSVEYRVYNPPIQDLLEADCPPVQNVFEADCPQALTNQVEISLQPVVDRSHSGRGSYSALTDDDLRSVMQEQNRLLSQILEQQKITNDLLMASMTLKN
ncbi:uncharacterized protein LOC123553315 [Mercenaria mercenaria]|uniref:uncharacterized protein LOC123553315 n=1 Tax=Mercenaria mercenaria TaxID=6596 RepID=UPI00234E878B|nr:uncharacterized protein LOC123553315 [Mercenaria mercenaria]